MLIQSLRLKNIKSYGGGPAGSGVTVRFESGVNRVAGRNGHGKTTLIECIGYALFLTEPEFEEHFHSDAYFLSHGAKEGEIELTFRCDGESFRVHRTVGKTTRRRSKVTQLSDQSLCAEGDQEVAAFLGRLLKLPEPGHLSEVFSKLVGIKQGRLAWPFDSKPGEARRYFEPLLEVEVFRDCFDRLKGSVEAFQTQKSERLEKKAAIHERIQDRANSPATFASAREKVAATTAALRAAEHDREAAFKILQQWETQAKAVEALEGALKTASDKSAHAQALRAESEARLTEAAVAGQVVAETQVAHQSHREALAALADLERRRELRDDLKQKRDAAELNRSNHQLKGAAAREQAAVFLGQSDAKQKENNVLTGKIASTQIALRASATAFQQDAAATAAADDHRETLGAWVAGLAGWVKAQRRIADTVARLSKEIAAWEGARLTVAGEAERTAAGVLKTAQDQLARAGQREATLTEQLRQIAGGICPFLNETCRQFDPAKVQSDLTQQAAATAGLRPEVEYARTAHQRTAAALTELTAAATKIAGKELDLVDSMAGYGEEATAGRSADAVASFTWLLQWEPQLPVFPAAPEISAGDLDPAAVARLQLQSESFVVSATAWWKQVDGSIRARLKRFQDEAKAREAQEAALDQLASQQRRSMEEIQALTQKAAGKADEARAHEQEFQKLTEEIGQLNDALAPFATLDANLKREQHARDTHRAAHERYLGAKKIADEWPQRQTRFQQVQTEVAAAQEALRGATAALLTARQAFEPEKLQAARDDHQARHDRATQLKVYLNTEQAVLQQEERRCQEWEQACHEGELVATEIGRCEAAIELTELARKTLRDTAPAVAQQLCNWIAKRAQRIFNQISPEPIELAWDAERYSLRISPGDRRFAMLSGGEQTKLALAMTLAMIEELSDLRFCSFDEPTYGVDADSRPKLADAIIQAQEAAGLDQLLIVSHDDAFEGRSGHAILLEKSADGTQVTLTQ